MVHIRPATQRDMPVLYHWAPHSAWETMTPQERAASRPQAIQAYAHGLMAMTAAAPETSVVLVAEAAGQPVGYVLGGVGPDSATGEPHGFLLDLFVVPPARRRGVARTLQQAAEQQFAAMGLRKVKMWSGMHNQAAIHMATKSGFKPEGLIGIKEW